MNEFQGFKIIKKEAIDEYNTQGVWAMLGKAKLNNSQRKYTCLDVGKSMCISEELKIDFERIENLKTPFDKEYRNQFNEVKFTYTEYPMRLDYLYNEISKHYGEFIFILVANQSEYLIEKYFAYSTKASYWVSSGKYSSEKEIDGIEIKRIRDDIDISKMDKILVEKINLFKDWYDNQ